MQEIWVETRVSTDIFILDKKKAEILLVGVEITNYDILTIVENKKLIKYDLLANEVDLIYKAKTKIIPYVMMWDGLVTRCHKKYIQAWKHLFTLWSWKGCRRVFLLREDEDSIKKKKRKETDKVHPNAQMYRVR